MNPSRNATGALLMVIAMAAFTCNDALVKSTTGAMNTGQILFVRGAMTSVLVVAIAWWMGALRAWRVMLQPALLLRLAAEILASITYISALGAMPLANTAAILQSLPLAVTVTDGRTSSASAVRGTARSTLHQQNASYVYLRLERLQFEQPSGRP